MEEQYEFEKIADLIVNVQNKAVDIFNEKKYEDDFYFTSEGKDEMMSVNAALFYIKDNYETFVKCIQYLEGFVIRNTMGVVNEGQESQTTSEDG